MLIGIVGKPSSGKTTFLNAACLTSAKVGSYPFTTIKPNPGVAYVRSTCPSAELGLTPNPQNSFCINGLRFIPVDLLDVAGLVPGAWEGKGLGNQFLDDLCRADALIHVVDASGSLDSTGHEVDKGSWDPFNDVEFLRHEISMWLLDIIKRDFRRIVGRVEAEKEDLSLILADKLSGLAITRNQVSLSIQKSGLDKKKPSLWNDDDVLQFTKVLQQNAKPMIIAANKIDRPAAKNWIKSLEEKCAEPIIPCCALGEYAFRTLTEKGYLQYRPGDPDFKFLKKEKIDSKTLEILEKLRENVLRPYGSTGIQKAVEYVVFNVLKMIVVYPVEDVNHYTDHHGNVLPDAYLVREGTTTREFAYNIHTDLGRTFINAIDARTKRRLSEEHTLKNGDIIRINAAVGYK